MSSPSLASRADTSSSETHATSEVPRKPGTLVISVRADERGAREAARWADQVQGATALVSADAQLEKQVDAAARVLVLDPGAIAAWRGFGAHASSRERLQLVARLADRFDHVTWVRTGTQADQWVRAGQA